MKISVEEPSSYQRVLTIEVPAETVNAEMEQIFSKLVKTATHPGFRKGRVPRKILENKFGDSVRQEAMESTISSSVKKALEEHELVPLTEPEVSEIKFDDGAPLSFQTTIEIAPTVELAEYKGIELKRPTVKIDDDNVNSVLEGLQKRYAKYIPTERPIEKGDFILIDFETFEDGKPMKDAKGENFPLEVGSGAFGEDFENQLIGTGKDDKKQITVKYAEDFRAKDLAGKEILFEVNVKDVKLRQLPELDDDFAKDLGEHGTLDELKQHIRETLEKDMKNRIDQSLRERAIGKITTESEVEIPPKLKSKVAASIFEEHMQRLAQSGADRETVAAERDKMAEYAEAEAARQLKLTFVTDEIARRENLDVSDEELKSSVDEMIEESEEQAPSIKSHFESERVRERYRDQLRIRKILDFVVSNAKIEEVDEVEAEPESTQPPNEEKGEN